MKNNLILIVFILAVFGCVSKSDYMRKNNTQPIIFEFIELEEKEKGSLIQLLIKLPINKLVFNKKDNSFISNVTIDLYILDDNDKIAYSNSWNENIIKNFYEDTKSKNKYVIKHYLELPIGFYKTNLAVNDFENHITFIDSGNFEVLKKQTKGNITFFYKEGDSFQYYIESNESYLLDTLWMSYQIFDDKNTNDDKKINLATEYFFKNKLVYEYSYNETSELIGNKYIPIPLIEKSFDKITVQILFKDNIINRNLYFENRIKINYDLAKLVGPMQYIIDSDKYNELYSLDSLKQINYLKSYWKLNDIESNNKKSYLLEEFYKRVEYANENFNYFNTLGWYTDRGKVYIVHGKPKEIKNDFNQNGEYEIWYYENKEFIFINKFGAYQLYNQYR